MVIIAMKRVDTVGTLAFVYKSMECVRLAVKPVIQEKIVKCVRMRGDCSFCWLDIDKIWDRNLLKKKSIIMSLSNPIANFTDFHVSLIQGYII